MPKVYIDMQGDRLVVESGGSINLKAGAKFTLDAAVSAALTTQLTAITIADAAGTPDYALQALTTTLPYGLATAQEAISVLYVIKNLQARMAEMELRLQALGMLS